MSAVLTVDDIERSCHSSWMMDPMDNPEIILDNPMQWIQWIILCIPVAKCFRLFLLPTFLLFAISVCAFDSEQTSLVVIEALDFFFRFVRFDADVDGPPFVVRFIVGVITSLSVPLSLLLSMSESLLSSTL